MMKKIEKKLVLTYLLFATLAFIFLLNSQLNPFGNGESTIDSSVFRTIAMMMEKGYTPYKDSFDHKGPIIFLINYVGTIISRNHGIWIIEFFSMMITEIALFCIARIVCESYYQNILSVIFSLSLLYLYFEGGNYTEEYAMPFLAVSLYIFLDYMINSYVTNLRILVCGLCFGTVCLLRPNMVGLWIIFCAAFFLENLIKKNYLQDVKFVICFLIGVCIVFIPIIMWLYSKNAVEDFWFDYIEFNMLYSSPAGGRVSIKTFLKSICFFSTTNIFLLSLEVMMFSFWRDKEKRIVTGIYILYMLINLPLMAMSGMEYGHYGMILLPSFTFPIAILLKYLYQKCDKFVTHFALIFVFLSVVIPLCLLTARNGYECLKCKGQLYEYEREIVSIIKENSENDECIFVYGNRDLFYVASGRKHATKYSYQIPIGQVYPLIMEECFASLEVQRPRLVIITPNNYDEDMMRFLNNNDYTVLWTNGNEEDGDRYTIFRSKD